MGRKLNFNDEVYSQEEIIELSQGCDGIFELTHRKKIDMKRSLIVCLHLLKLFQILQLDLEILIIKQQKKKIS